MGKEKETALGNCSCNLCEQDSASVLFVKKGFTLVRCAHCDLVFVGNPPAKAELAKLYSFESGYHVCFRNDSKDCEKNFAIARRHYQFMKTYKSKGRLLDIGCSAGFFLKVARDYGWETCGLEISKDTATIAQQRYGLRVIINTLDESTFVQNSFDVVTLWDVLEHVDNPKKMLSVVNRILKDDGLILISTPNIDGLFPQLSYKVARIMKHWPHPEPPRHLFQFSRRTLHRLLALTGFTLVEVHDERIPLTYTFPPKDLLLSPKLLVYALIFFPAALIGPIVHAGDSLIVVAKKAHAT